MKRQLDWTKLARAERVPEQSALDYDRRATANRPTGDALDAEIRRLHGLGLTPRDVESALRLSPETVADALRLNQSAPEPPEPAPGTDDAGPCPSCRLRQVCRVTKVACEDFVEFTERGRYRPEDPARPRRPTSAIARKLGL